MFQNKGIAITGGANGIGKSDCSFPAFLSAREKGYSDPKNAPILNKIAVNQNRANEKEHQSHGQRKGMPDKSHLLRISRVVTNLYF